MFSETTIRAARYAKTEARVLLRNNVQAICLANHNTCFGFMAIHCAFTFVYSVYISWYQHVYTFVWMSSAEGECEQMRL